MSTAPRIPQPEADPISTRPDDESRSAWRFFLAPALLTLVGYIVFYACDARMRTADGPWEVTFATNASGTPVLQITQPALRIQRVTIAFPGERLPPPSSTNATAIATDPVLPTTLRFDAPARALPFGRTAFDDLMYLPGTVVIHCFGHEVQLVPRKLYLNREGVDWSNDTLHELHAEDRLPTLDPPPSHRPSNGSGLGMGLGNPTSARPHAPPADAPTSPQPSPAAGRPTDPSVHQ